MSDAESVPESAAVLQSMTLLATLSTAEDVRRSIADRRAGHDPAAQEQPDVATAHLHTAGTQLMDLLMQLMLGRMHIAHQDERPLAAVVRHFDVMMKLRQAERLLHQVHQRLLSLYPDVSDALVEEAREVHADVYRLLDADAETLLDALDPLVERGISLVVWTRHET